ncbi:MAG: hypothetical protein J6Y62_05845 [Clostridia bacterium]|nr:hypothetical protein [Clostridia bacterium]
MVKIYFKRLHPLAKAPYRAHPTDAGADLYAATCRPAGDYSFVGCNVSVVEYGTGLAFSIPRGMAWELKSRSSIWKMGMCMCNGSGLFDESFHLEARAYFYQFNPVKKYAVGDRIAQFVLMPYVDPREIEFVDVGDGDLPTYGQDREGGVGSTGLK